MCTAFTKLSSTIRTTLALATLLGAYGAGIATHASLSQPEVPVNWSESAQLVTILGFDYAAEVEDLLLAVVTLEHAVPLTERSAGCQYSLRADRYITASRLLTDREVAARHPEARTRLARLRKALEKFAAAVPEATMTHSTAASGFYRETRLQMIGLERMTRDELVGTKNHPGEFQRSSGYPMTSDPINIDGIKGIILGSNYLENALFGTMEPGWRAEAEAQRIALMDTLPELQAALREWPPEFSKKVEAYIQEWMREWMES